MKLKYIEKQYNVDDNDEIIGIKLKSYKHLKEGKIINLNKELDNLINHSIDESSYVFFEGDWELRVLEFIEVLKIVQKNNLTIYLKTDLSFDDFKLRVGIACYEKVKDVKMPLKDISENDIPMLILIGSMMMDVYLKDVQYYVNSVENDGRKLHQINLPEGENENEG